MNLPVAWNDEQSIRTAFAYLTKLGVAPKFGTVPIAYYQQDQVRAIDIIETRAVQALGLYPTGNIPITVRKQGPALHAKINGTRTWQFIGWIGDIRRDVRYTR